MARTAEEVLADVVQLVVGVQVPISIVGGPAALGTGYDAWQRLRDDITGGHSFGWLGTDTAEYIERLRKTVVSSHPHAEKMEESRYAMIGHLIAAHDAPREIRRLDGEELVAAHREAHPELVH